MVATCRNWQMQMIAILGRIQAELFNQAIQIHRNQNLLVLALINLPIFPTFSHSQTGSKRLLLTKGRTQTSCARFTAHSKFFEARILFGFYKMYVQGHSIFLCLIPSPGSNYFKQVSSLPSHSRLWFCASIEEDEIWRVLFHMLHMSHIPSVIPTGECTWWCPDCSPLAPHGSPALWHLPDRVHRGNWALCSPSFSLGGNQRAWRAAMPISAWAAQHLVDVQARALNGNHLSCVEQWLLLCNTAKIHSY